MSPLNKFDHKIYGSISFEEYYRKCYNIQITDKRPPLLKVIRKDIQQEEEQKVIYLIPELVFPTGLTK